MQQLISSTIIIKMKSAKIFVHEKQNELEVKQNQSQKTKNNIPEAGIKTSTPAAKRNALIIKLIIISY